MNNYKLKKLKLNVSYWIRLGWMKLWFAVGLVISIIGLICCLPIILLLSFLHHLLAAIAVMEIGQLKGILDTAKKVTDALNHRLGINED